MYLVKKKYFKKKPKKNELCSKIQYFLDLFGIFMISSSPIPFKRKLNNVYIMGKYTSFQTMVISPKYLIFRRYKMKNAKKKI